ncbi:hypothetical protein SFMTTN_3514 [Sulfuriferula multivorans]|uniref:Uncharacterized protein n=1 Tax=Sulfuriferula multivorans TaxID=1559896 RepID=A0A401JHW8_9PROT|nr:hypothetical protein SFMTTN_3514 [Sulfuriferula multivorans]
MFVGTGGLNARFNEQLADSARNRKTKSLSHFNASGGGLKQRLSLLG